MLEKRLGVSASYWITKNGKLVVSGKSNSLTRNMFRLLAGMMTTFGSKYWTNPQLIDEGGTGFTISPSSKFRDLYISRSLVGSSSQSYSFTDYKLYGYDPSKSSCWELTKVKDITISGSTVSFSGASKVEILSDFTINEIGLEANYAGRPFLVARDLISSLSVRAGDVLMVGYEICLGGGNDITNHLRRALANTLTGTGTRGFSAVSVRDYKGAYWSPPSPDETLSVLGVSNGAVGSGSKGLDPEDYQLVSLLAATSNIGRGAADITDTSDGVYFDFYMVFPGPISGTIKEISK